LFFGWVVVGAAFSVLAVAYALQFSYGVFLPEIAAELDWDRSTLSAPYALFVVGYTSLSLITGRLTDRFGPRIVISLGALGLALGYSLVGTITEPWELYLYLGVFAAIGASVAFVPCNATVIRWFIRRRGFALGMASCGVSAAAAIGPPVAGLLIEQVGWRQALFTMAIGGSVVVVIAAQAMVRDPESRRLSPDGDASPTDANPVITGWTLREALHTRALWLLLASLMATWLVVFLPFVHLGAYGLDLGFNTLDAAALISAIGFGGLAGRIVTGALTDRFGRIPGLALALTFQSVAFLGFAGSGTYAWLLGWAFTYGFGYSGVSVLFPALLGDFFGRAHVGAIAGFMFGIGGVAAAAGPYAAGLIFDHTGTYSTTFVASSVLNSLALLLLVFLRAPVAPRRSRRNLSPGTMVD